jgi:6-phosphofructokinase 1
MELPTLDELEIAALGPGRLPSPLRTREHFRFVSEDSRVLAFSDTSTLDRLRRSGEELPSFEPAGPRERLFFDPDRLTCAIVTCGGLCPGLNDVIRSIVRSLNYSYGVSRVLGYRYGYAGLSSSPPADPVELTPSMVNHIHERGGTFLASSRGPQDVGEMVDTLVRHGVGILFAIGGDGTLRGAASLCEEIRRRGLEISVVGIPKTIDNDLEWTARTFGFATAVEAARVIIEAGHNEAIGAWNGIGLIKLMGRHSGFIAANACLASADTNYCLIPEVPFVLDGEGSFLEVLEERMDRVRHAVIVVAEGAGQEFLELEGPAETDASGNVRLKDIGTHLRDRIAAHFGGKGKKVSIKYIDPSYTIRSLAANAFDSEFCLVLGQHAVHAGMAGRTNLLIGFLNQRFTHVPIPVAVGRRKQVQPDGEIWQRVLDATGQPSCMFRYGT